MFPPRRMPSGGPFTKKSIENPSSFPSPVFVPAPSRSQAAFFIVRKSSNTVHALVDYFDLVDTQGVDPSDLCLGFADPSNLEKNPGWPLRNFLLAAVYHFNRTRFEVLCFRENPATSEINHSIVLDVSCGNGDPKSVVPRDFDLIPAGSVVGWEKKEGKLTPKVVDLGSLMDPIK